MFVSHVRLYYLSFIFSFFHLLIYFLLVLFLRDGYLSFSFFEEKLNVRPAKVEHL